MGLRDIIEEQKRKSTIIQHSLIELQYLIDLTSQVFNKNASSSPDFKDACNMLHTLCDNGVIGLEELKTLIPVVKEDN